jgi:hypothetical protein
MATAESKSSVSSPLGLFRNDYDSYDSILLALYCWTTTKALCECTSILTLILLIVCATCKVQSRFSAANLIQFRASR